MGHFRVLAQGNTKDPNVAPGSLDVSSSAFQVINAQGNFVDLARQLIHPTLGTLTYEDSNLESINPDITRNFIESPAQKVDTTVKRTIGSSIITQQAQVAEDVVISEVWTGGGTKLSVLASMFRTFHLFWVTLPPVGTTLTWLPRELSVESFGVLMVNVQLGGPDLEYREIPTVFGQQAGAFLKNTLIVQFKIAPEEIAPQGTVTLIGL